MISRKINLSRSVSKKSLKSQEPSINDFINGVNLSNSPFTTSKISKRTIQSEYKIRNRSRSRELIPPKYRKSRGSSKRSVEKERPHNDEYISVISGGSKKLLSTCKIQPSVFKTSSLLGSEKVNRRLYQTQTNLKPRLSREKEIVKNKPLEPRSYFKSYQSIYKPIKERQRSKETSKMKKKPSISAVNSTPLQQLTAFERSKLRHGISMKRKDSESPQPKSILTKERTVGGGAGGSALTSPYKKKAFISRESSPLNIRNRRKHNNSPYASKSPDRKREKPFEDEAFFYNTEIPQTSRENDALQMSRVSMMYRDTPILSKKNSKPPSRNPSKDNIDRKRRGRRPNAPTSTPIANISKKNLKEKSMKKKEISRNLKYRIKELFVNIARDNENLEFARQELALKPDLSLADLFRCFDESNRGALSFSEFSRNLRKLGLKESRNSKAVTSLFEHFDQDCDSFINIKEFTKIFSPLQKEYNILMNCRADKDVKSGTDLARV